MVLSPMSGFPAWAPTEGQGIPRESDFEGQWDLITGFPQEWKKQIHSWRAHQEMARVNDNILRISELKMDWNGWILLRWPLYLLLWQEFLRRNRVALIVNKRVWNTVLGCNLKNYRMISVHFQGKPFNIMVIQVYTPTGNAEEAEVEWFY